MDKVFECQQCGNSFARAQHLAKHKTIHSDAKPYACRICGTSFRIKELLKSHEKIHRNENKTVRCNTCGKTFAWKNQLRHPTPSTPGTLYRYDTTRARPLASYMAA